LAEKKGSIIYTNWHELLAIEEKKIRCLLRLERKKSARKNQKGSLQAARGLEKEKPLS